MARPIFGNGEDNLNIWQEVKERYSLQDLAAEYGVDLRGDRGICPSCKYEKKPSLYVNEDFFKCHHCDFKGDLFSFVSILEDCDRWGALKKLAKQAGIEYHQTKDDIKRESQSEKYKAMAEKYARDIPKEALNYLLGRALSREFIESRLIGWVPPTERHSDAETGLPGILAGRILIPFWQGSQIVYMTGRSLGDEQPKYKNQKGPKTWIGTMRGPHLIITEGIFDQLLAEQAGTHCIGLAGSSQEIRLHRGIKSVLLAFDNDKAGHEYTQRHLPGLCKQCDHVQVAELPEGCKDLADYLAVGNKIDDLKRITAAQYYLSRLAENPELRERRQACFLAMARMDSVDREKNLKIMSEMLSASVKSIRADMADYLKEEQQSEYVAEDGAKFKVPDGYTLTGKGIIWNKTQIAFEPILIDKHGSDPRTHEEYYNVRFGNRGRILPRLATSKSQDLLEFAKYGVPVNSANAVHIIRFLDAWNAANKDKYQNFTVSSQLGWFEDSFVMTDRIIGNDKKELHYVGTIIQNGSYTPGGTLDGWINTVKMLNKWPEAAVARFCLYAGFASAILEPLNIRPFIIHLCGDTSIGKTTALRIPASIYGNPVEGKAMIRWKNTENFLIRYMENLKNIPLVIDESSSESKAIFESIIYQMESGISKGKALKNDPYGAAILRTFRLGVFSSGEPPVLNERFLSGAQIRVMELHGSPMGGEIAERDIEQFNSGLMKNYGHAIDLFIEQFGKIEREDWMKSLVKCNDELTTVEKRMKKHIDLISMCGCVASELFGLDFPYLKDCKIVFDRLRAMVVDKTKTVDKILQVIEDHYQENLLCFPDITKDQYGKNVAKYRENKTPPHIYGYVFGNDLGIIKSHFKKMLEDNFQHVNFGDFAIRILKEKKIIEVNDQSVNRTIKKIDGKNVYLIYFPDFFQNEDDNELF